MFTLAATGAPIDPHDKWLWGVLAIMAILAVGLIMIVLLTVAWRRYNRRLDQSEPRPPRDDTDIWREAAGRWRDEQPERDDDDDDDDDTDQRQLDR